MTRWLGIWCAVVVMAGSCFVRAEEAPRLFQSEGAALAESRQRLQTGDAEVKSAVQSLTKAADSALTDGPFSVVQKKHPAPGGDPHDYVSLAPYFWPNPDTKDGLPYVRHDGRRNPETKEYDVARFSDMSGDTYTLALAYYFTGDERYADRAALLIRTWFLDDATKMNPNLQHAQFIKGVNDGRGIGIIESARLLNVIDAVGLLHGSRSWTPADDEKLRAWFTDFVKWMRESKNGQDEAAATNNHGSWYDVQLTSYLMFLGRNDEAKQVVEAAKTKRVAKQIEPDGRMPRELARTKALGYSRFNLTALTQLADLGKRLGVDLWHYRTNDGRCIQAALDWIIPFATGEKKWSYEQIEPISGKSFLIAFRRAAIAYGDEKYEAAIAKLTGEDDSSRDMLRFPPPKK